MSASNINISENQEPSSIYDIETQKFEGHETITSNSIHDIETQIFPTDGSTHPIQANTKINKQLESKLNVQDEVTSTSVTDIHDMETQHYINELETQKNEDNIQNVILKRFTTDIHNAETQNYIDGSKNDGNTKKSKIDKNKNQKKGLNQVECNINDSETLKFDNKDIAEDLSNVETQMDNIVNDINNDRVNTDIAKITKNGINDDNEEDKDNTVETIKTKINYDNVAQSPNSRSSSPGSLNLSSPGVDKDYVSSLHSDHLLESSDLLEYFGEGIDKDHREEIRASNTSTPKSHTNTSERDNNVENVSNNDEDNIFDALTQRLCDFEGKSDEINKKNVHKLSKKKNESTENINNDPEMNAEEYPDKLVRKQRKSLEISDKSCNDDIDNRNDPGTSIESEDIFDALTQSNSLADKDTSNSSGSNQLSKINETNAVVDDMASTQIINNDENTYDQDNLANKSLVDINDINDINNAIEEGRTKHVGRKNIRSFQTDADDSLEQKLNEMFENVNSSIHEPSHLSTQALEDILESSQSDNELSVNKYTVNESSRTDSVLQTQIKKKSRTLCNQSPCDIADTEANNINNVEIDLQTSDTHFSPLTRQKRNILRETQKREKELVDSMLQNVTSSHQDSNTSRISKVNNEKVDNTVTEFNKRDKKTSRSRNETNIMTDSLNDDNVTETTSNNNRNNENNLRLLMKRKYGAASEADSKRVLKNDSNKVEVDNVEKDSGGESNVCAPCSSRDAERAQTSDISYESDDDILTRLPAVKISGTLSNPASPSASSTSTVCSERLKRVKGRNKKIIRNKLRKQGVEDAEKNGSSNQKHDKTTVSLDDDNIPDLDVSKTNKMTKHVVDTSDDSDSEMKNKRFKQMADRIMLNSKDDYPKRGKKNVRNTFDKKESAPNLLSNLSNNLKLDTDDELKISSQTTSSSRITRHSSKQNGETSDVSRKETRVENVTYDKSTKPETRSIVTRKKRTVNTIEKDVEETNSRKRKAHQVIEERPILTRARRNTVKTDIDRQSPILDYFTKTNSRENSPVIGNTKALDLKTDENVDSGRFNIKRAKRKINDDQTARNADVTANKSSVSNEQVQVQQRQMNLSQDKVLKVVISPIRRSVINSIEDESQEVEMITGKNLNNVQDKNLSIRETNTAKMFKKKSRIRSRKQLNIDTETDSAFTESNTSFFIDDSNNTQSDDSILKIKIRKRFTKSSTVGTHALEKKETFKKPISVNQNSASSIFDSSTEDTTSQNSRSSESSQNSNTENDTSLSSRSSRSKTASIRKKEKNEVTQNMRRMINDSTSSRINTSTEITPLPSTSSTRMRRSTSVFSYSTPSTARHRVLFTGITEDYSNIVKTLGE